MKAYGEVTECRGNIDFRGPRNGRPVCREKLSADDFQLVAGPEDQQHIVSVKPRGNGTEFGLVYVQTRGKTERGPRRSPLGSALGSRLWALGSKF